MSEKRSLPEWTPPDRPASGGLQLYNSLTRTKTEFRSLTDGLIKWYNCGPTVYDSAHMGHARSYITFDIIRRVLRDYFRYEIFFVQNVTDIDDKIIRRARQNYLFERYVSEVDSGKKSLPEILNDTGTALKEFETKLTKETDPDKRTMLTKMIEQAKRVMETAADDPARLTREMKDIMSGWLDTQFGNNVTDREIFIELPRFYENDYNEDMRALNILPPDCVTRVSEYVPEIVEYVQKIIDNGYGYVSNGSVYFDTERFARNPKHFYAKLVPEAYGDQKALAEGEGDLSGGTGDEKRNPNDFALWKCSKPGEPCWESPWGRGRPGWHIECSVMASSVIPGEQIDIHSGGVDLRFPHHDNEMAQAEAYYDTGRPWINYFLHSGHLTISGCKMSKSLKNFITIKEALKRNTARQLRIAFLMHSWKDTLDYSDNTMNDAIHFERTLNEFFLTVKDILRRQNRAPSDQPVKWQQEELELNEKFMEHIGRIDQALKDNIDTKRSCEELRRLITSANIYIQNKQNHSNGALLTSVASYVTRMMDMFGCVGFGVNIGFPTTAANGGDLVDKEQIIMPFIESIARLRDEIRNVAKELKDKQLFGLCDRIRDDIFPELGVRMEDFETPDGQQQWRLKLVDREILMQERRRKQEEQEQAALAKKMQQEAKLAAAAAEEPPVDPKKMFLSETDKYSRFDDDGCPTHDQDGNELTKSALKKVAKIFKAQEKKYQSWLQKQQQKNSS